MSAIFKHPAKWHATFLELNRSHPNRYHNEAVWFCYSGLTRESSCIHGGLAQVLETYPSLFKLTLIAAPTAKGGNQ